MIQLLIKVLFLAIEKYYFWFILYSISLVVFFLSRGFFFVDFYVDVLRF